MSFPVYATRPTLFLHRVIWFLMRIVIRLMVRKLHRVLAELGRMSDEERLVCVHWTAHDAILLSFLCGYHAHERCDCELYKTDRVTDEEVIKMTRAMVGYE